MRTKSTAPAAGTVRTGLARSFPFPPVDLIEERIAWIMCWNELGFFKTVNGEAVIAFPSARFLGCPCG